MFGTIHQYSHNESFNKAFEQKISHLSPTVRNGFYGHLKNKYCKFLLIFCKTTDHKTFIPLKVISNKVSSCSLIPPLSRRKYLQRYKCLRRESRKKIMTHQNAHDFIKLRDRETFFSSHFRRSRDGKIIDSNVIKRDFTVATI